VRAITLSLEVHPQADGAPRQLRMQPAPLPGQDATRVTWKFLAGRKHLLGTDLGSARPAPRVPVLETARPVARLQG